MSRLGKPLPTLLAVTGALLIGLVLSWPARGYVEAPMSLGAVIAQSTNILTMRVEKVDKERNLIIFRKVKDLKGVHPTDVIKHNIGRGGFHPREWQFIMEWAEPGRLAVFCHNGGASETCITNYWYQAYAGGEWWNMSHGEPYLLRSFAGQPEKLASAVEAILAGQEVVVPCMVDGDKNALQLRNAKIQRLRASLKLQDYNPKRDFVGWGGEDFRQLAGMPGFTHLAQIGRVDPEALGVSAADFDGDRKMDLCLFGTTRVMLLQNAGSSFNEISLPHVGGARAACWADFDGDGKPDLFLAAPSGPKLLHNRGNGTFADMSSALPREAYYNLTAAVWTDADGDGKPDLLLANGHLGLRLYRNLGKAEAVSDPVRFTKWKLIGPFDNSGQRGFDTAYPPEKEIDFAKQYDGKGGKVAWRDVEFADGVANNLAIFGGNLNNDAVVYLHREIEAKAAVELPVAFGSDDTLTVWLNGEKLIAENVYRALTVDQTKAVLKLRPGKNSLLVKVCQGGGDWAFSFSAQMPKVVLPQLFEDVSSRWNLGPTGPLGLKKQPFLLAADLNGDKRVDCIYGSQVLLNTARGFVELQQSGLFFDGQAGLPVLADFDGGGRPDLLVPQLNGCRLFLNDGTGRFRDATRQSGDLATLSGQAVSAASADFDGNGTPDLLVACLRGPNRLFLNQGKGRFTEATESFGLHQRIFNSRAILAVDLNGDSVLDVVFNNEGQEATILLGKPRQLAHGGN
ncbi:MAG: VCBS repeat-containing protein [Gemmatales bacterium]|nr:VCBS repeat-containing protein [Gemmatales bacterium]MDW8387300.1 VCBS repeat-containing protein [Gemmatales bacterium]